jgi:hypothetical protein
MTGTGTTTFFFLVSDTSYLYSINRIWLYQNGLVEDGYVHFEQVDMTSAWNSLLGGIGWTSSPLCSVDFDYDEDMDILFGNAEGKVYWMENIGSEIMDENIFVLETEPIIETGWQDRGITMLAAADFDQDNDTDIVIGSVSREKLAYYQNPGTDLFGGKQDIGGEADEGVWGERFCGAATFHVCTDIDSDGFPDLLVGTDGYNYGNGIGGRVYHFDFRLWDGKFLVRRILTLPRSEGDDDLDFIAFTDNTGDGRPDNIFAGDYYIEEDDDPPLPYPAQYPAHGPSWTGWDGGYEPEACSPEINTARDESDEKVEVKALPIEETEYYNLHAVAESDPVAPLCEMKNLITKVIFKDLEQGILGKRENDIKLIYYVSNNNGSSWYQVESFSNNNIKDKDGKIKEIKFKSYGSQLCWKAVFIAKGDEVEKDTQIGASLAAPYIDSLTLEYFYVEEMEFSRASSVATGFRLDGSVKNAVIAPSFVFPSFEGHLRAYDITAISFSGESSYDIKTVSRHDADNPTGRDIQAENTSIVWDAGEVLNLRNAENRNIYTAIPVDPKTGPLSRLEFTNQNYDQMKKYFKTKSTLIDFIRGENRDFKLGWIDHSTPVVVNPPSRDDSIMGHEYQSFEDGWSDREKMVIVGSNGGMLHCFKVTDGDELWAFIPFNILKRLKKIGKKNKKTGSFDFNSKGEVYVDGSPVVADVYIDSDGDGNKEWATLLICGNGKAKGKGLKNQRGQYYFFGLDITDPEDPRPLWEIGLDKCGYTESPAVICRILWEDEERWVAFMGSGADKGEPRLFCVDAETGELLWSFKGEGDGMPASPSVYDIDCDGNMDRVYFSTFKGNIEDVDPVEDTQDPGKFYTRFINPSAGSLLGVTSLYGEVEHISLASKTRASFSVGGTREFEGKEERDIWINEYDSTLQVLSRGGGTLKEHPDSPGNRGLKIRSWREVRDIIRNQ